MNLHWKQLCAMAALFLASKLVKGNPCTISELPPDNGICVAKVDCQNYIHVDLESWDCIKHVQEQSYYSYRNNHYYTPVYTYDSKFNLIVTVKKPYSLNLFDFDKYNCILKLIVEDGLLITIPEEVYSMSRLQYISLSGNQINTINFDTFLAITNLNEINLSNNLIQMIENNDDINTYGQLSNVTIINISSNKIKDIPNSFLSKYVHLKHLNLSHNLIDSVSILTFEGIVQLQTLDLSYNKLLEVGNAFVRFTYLKYLSIAHNNLTKLDEFNLVTLTNLQSLYINFNDIVDIENKTFQSLVKLKILDLSHNNIAKVYNIFFSNNKDMYSLSLSNNRIQFIEANSFINKHITDFDIQSNKLTGPLIKNSFDGLMVDELNLSGANFTSIEDEAFIGISNLIHLNLSLNALNNISEMAFSSLTSLDILDLSQNQLCELAFQSIDLKNLSRLIVHHNKIESISKLVFEHLQSLEELDLSFNVLLELESGLFSNLKNVASLKVLESNFVNILQRKSLEGLITLQTIDMQKTRTTIFQNESFSGLVALTHINSTYGQLSDIEYNAFLGTDSLKVLSLSNNQLRYFCINTSTILHLNEIHLNNNFIKNITNETFSNLTELQTLNLANNDILILSSDVFQYLIKLMYLDLLSNKNMKIVGNPFRNIKRLNKLSLKNVRSEITFNNSSAVIEVLDLQSCYISNINKLYIFNVFGLNYLNLSNNDITSIDKDSFQHMSTLVSLDLSFNKIMFIQPGSFLKIKELVILNLSENNLPLIQFGVFDGVKVLRELDLSSNVISNFDIKLLPNVTKLFLDDNLITNFNFKDILNTDLDKLSIGGNKISCKVLMLLRTSSFADKFLRIVTAKTLNYHSENVNGISCQSVSDNQSVINASSENSINFSPLISSLKNAINIFDKSMQSIISKYTNKTDTFNDETRNIGETMKQFLESQNKNQIIANNYLTRLNDISNSSNLQLSNIKKYLMNLTLTKTEAQLIKQNFSSIDTTSNAKNLIENEHYMRSEFQKMLKQENDALREEFRIALDSNSKSLSSQAYFDAQKAHHIDSGDSKLVVYFIAVCLAVMVIAYISNLVYTYVQKVNRNQNLNHSSVAIITDGIEME